MADSLTFDGTRINVRRDGETVGVDVPTGALQHALNVLNSRITGWQAHPVTIRKLELANG